MQISRAIVTLALALGAAASPVTSPADNVAAYEAALAAWKAENNATTSGLEARQSCDNTYSVFQCEGT